MERIQAARLITARYAALKLALTKNVSLDVFAGMKFDLRQIAVLAATAAGIQVSRAENPTLRPLSTDRPDATESPYTVDKGHFQIEMEMASATRGGGEESYAFAEMNLKYGFGADSDLQFVLPLYGHVAGGADGFGDMQIRVKHNLWGNNDGDTALAIMPYVQIPTGADGLSSDEVEGGIIVPLAVEGPDGWGFGFQVQADVVADETGDGHHFSFLASATAAHSLTECVGFFVEAVGIAGEGSEASTEAYFNTGLTWAARENLQFDGGVRIGLTDDSEDFTPFIGVSSKF